MTVAGNYYYLVSSLPFLRFGVTPPISRRAFLNQCEAHLPPVRFRALAGISRVPRAEPCCDVEERWNAWETCLRNAFVRLRAARRNLPADDFLRPDLDSFADLEKQVMEAFDGTNPAEEREALDRLRWRKLCDLEVGHAFDFEFLALYHIKLILLEKWADLSAARGQAELDRVVQAKIPELDLSGA